MKPLATFGWFMLVISIMYACIIASWEFFRPVNNKDIATKQYKILKQSDQFLSTRDSVAFNSVTCSKLKLNFPGGNRILGINANMEVVPVDINLDFTRDIIDWKAIAVQDSIQLGTNLMSISTAVPVLTIRHTTDVQPFFQCYQSGNNMFSVLDNGDLKWRDKWSLNTTASVFSLQYDGESYASWNSTNNNMILNGDMYVGQTGNQYSTVYFNSVGNDGNDDYANAAISNKKISNTQSELLLFKARNVLDRIRFRSNGFKFQVPGANGNWDDNADRLTLTNTQCRIFDNALAMTIEGNSSTDNLNLFNNTLIVKTANIISPSNTTWDVAGICNFVTSNIGTLNIGGTAKSIPAYAMWTRNGYVRGTAGFYGIPTGRSDAPTDSSLTRYYRPFIFDDMDGGVGGPTTFVRSSNNIINRYRSATAWNWITKPDSHVSYTDPAVYTSWKVTTAGMYRMDFMVHLLGANQKIQITIVSHDADVQIGITNDTYTNCTYHSFAIFDMDNVWKRCHVTAIAELAANKYVTVIFENAKNPPNDGRYFYTDTDAMQYRYASFAMQSI
jgi:hypothetical protein